ncbi:hypothetical protein F5Y07DRAFT_349873 [Xylaria sp. FL0933]|nr:hypothetical protein F5Y07DRAFT_349873 [Xylaria sp. FL0933]
MGRSEKNQSRGNSPPPPYSTLDPAAGPSHNAPRQPLPLPPRRWRNQYSNRAASAGRGERTPLIVRHHEPVVIVQPPAQHHHHFELSTPRVIVNIYDGVLRRPFLVPSILLSILAASAFLFGIYRSFSYLASLTPTLPPPPPIYNIAIIGAGPAGIAAAQYLLCSPAARAYVDFNITIFESSPVIGGALAVHDANGNPVFPNDDPTQGHITAEDIAGTALMWQNSLFTRDSEELLGDKVFFTESGPQQVGYYADNAHSIASSARPYRKQPLSTWSQLLWTYGASVYRAARFNEDGNLREKMLKAPITTDAEKIFDSLGVLEPLQQWAGTLLKKTGISEKYATEILEPQAQRAFGQGLSRLTGFAAMLAAAQEDSANAYTGGHMVQRLEQIAHKIDVPVRTSTRVVGLDYDYWEKTWGVQYAHEGKTASETFDKVILTALDLGIRLESSESDGMHNLSSFYEPELNGKTEGGPEDDYFVPVYVTFFTSPVKLAAWGEHEQVLFLKGSGVAEELTLVRETTSHMGTQYLYRVLSDFPVIDELKDLYDVSWSYETRILNWQPARFPLFRMPSFEWPMAKGLWWSSVIQHAWSTVDLNWLAGKAVADDLIKEVLDGN